MMKATQISLLTSLLLLMAAASASPVHAVQYCGSGSWVLGKFQRLAFRGRKVAKPTPNVFREFTGAPNFRFMSTFFLGVDGHAFQDIGVDLASATGYSCKIAVDGTVSPGCKNASFFTPETIQGARISKMLKDQFGNTVISANGLSSSVMANLRIPGTVRLLQCCMWTCCMPKLGCC
jgi:hypothetical protein